MNPIYKGTSEKVEEVKVQDGHTLLEYVGPMWLPVNFQGLQSGVMYRVGLNKPFLQIQNIDLRGLSSSVPGLLDRFKNGKREFNLVYQEKVTLPVDEVLNTEVAEPVEVTEVDEVAKVKVFEDVDDSEGLELDLAEMNSNEIRAKNFTAEEAAFYLDQEANGPKNRTGVKKYLQKIIDAAN